MWSHEELEPEEGGRLRQVDGPDNIRLYVP